VKPPAAAILLAIVSFSGCSLHRAPESRLAADQPPPAPKVAPPLVRMSPFSLDPASAITASSVRAHMTFLASDALNGRGSGTRDEWIAAEYLGAQMLQWGLEPLGDDGGFVQKVEIERFETTGPPVLSAAGARFEHGQQMLVQVLAGARASGLLQHYKPGVPVRPGAIVLMPELPGGAGGPPQQTTAQATAGAALVLLPETPAIRSRWETLATRNPAPPARLVGVQAAPPARPSTVVLDKASYAAFAALADGTPVALEAPVKPASTARTWNAAGRITGSDPAAASEVLLLSAHLDHVGSRPARDGAPTTDTIYNGADDDASGSVAVLELAKALAQGPRPRRTIVFALFGSEEAGGYGSRFFADKPIVPLAHLVANLQFEMIGRPDPAVPPHTLWLTGYERSNLGPSLAKQGAKLVQDPHPEQSFFTRSDNIQFARRGVIAHTVSSYGLHKEYHQPSDDVRQIDVAHMTDAIRSMLEPIRWLANSTFKPEWLPGMKP
jgi:hypothetical protein